MWAVRRGNRRRGSMRREGRVSGKPTNHSRLTGKCKVVGCLKCHDSLPLNKSRGKGKGRIKRLVSDIPSTHLLSDWRVCKPSSLSSRRNVSRKIARHGLKWDADTDWASDDEDVEAKDGGNYRKEAEGWDLSISVLLDIALEHIQEASEDKIVRQEAHKELLDSQEARESHGTLQGCDGDSIGAEAPDFETFKNEFEVFKTEIESECSPSSVAECSDSWSGIELSDADKSSLGDWEDDWSLVGAEIAV